MLLSPPISYIQIFLFPLIAAYVKFLLLKTGVMVQSQTVIELIPHAAENIAF